ncbi:MAG: ester cyclase, partial [Myxococcota bacterium]
NSEYASPEAMLEATPANLSAAATRRDHSSDAALTENKSLVARMFLEVVNLKAYSVADEIFADDFVWPQFGLEGPEGVKTWARAFHAGWPDVQDRLDLQIAEGDMVISLVTVYGTQTGEWLGYPPSNCIAVFPAIGIDRVVDGKIVERSATFNLKDVLRQLGHEE